MQQIVNSLEAILRSHWLSSSSTSSSINFSSIWLTGVWMHMSPYHIACMVFKTIGCVQRYSNSKKKKYIKTKLSIVTLVSHHSLFKINRFFSNIFFKDFFLSLPLYLFFSSCHLIKLILVYSSVLYKYVIKYATYYRLINTNIHFNCQLIKRHSRWYVRLLVRTKIVAPIDISCSVSVWL